MDWEKFLLGTAMIASAIVVAKGAEKALATGIKLIPAKKAKEEKE
jgi:hypothetical protein